MTKNPVVWICNLIILGESFGHKVVKLDCTGKFFSSHIPACLDVMKNEANPEALNLEDQALQFWRLNYQPFDQNP